MDLLFANDRRGAFPPSLYAEGITDTARPALRGESRADVVVVGAGLTGLSAALHLARVGRRVIVLEAHRAGFGASGRNGGQVGSGQRLEVDDLERMVGRIASRRLWDMAEEAKALTRDLAAPANVPFHPGIAHAARTQSEVRHAHAIAEKLARDYGYDKVQPLDREGLRALVRSDAYIGGDVDRGAGHLDPLALTLGLARQAEAAGALIHELSHVHRITHADRAGGTSIVQAGHGRVICDHVILAANGYLGGLDDRIAARVMPINNFVIATEPLGKRANDVLCENVAAHDTRFVVNYWRLDDARRLIFGGGENVSYRFPRDIAGKVKWAMLQVYPQLHDVKITHAWGGTLAITMTRLPVFTRPAPNCLSASGYSGHGVALANLAGKLMAQAVQGQSDGFDTMAALPQPSFPGGVAFRWPLLVAGMSWYSLRDRLGV
ncbi:FAD-binding oxidoreductase [uncultured Paracoccus sp.]|uniref:NAD(P)/FAD-dependent oxidoreductase n=1 Tax=uncultured Paracoccus sp. TaxID=189685 RepID=UPI002632B9F1|nr:FAD-binding oxidoreductase [uncultured Paracoccus sp.]